MTSSGLPRADAGEERWLGIDIGGSRIKSGIVTPQGEITESRSVTTPNRLDEFRTALRTSVGELLASAGPVRAIGFGCKGILSPETTEVKILPGACRFLEGARLDRLLDLSPESAVPIAADNDARVALLGELTWGAARGRKNAIMITLGSGLGGAILADGQVVRGAGGVAGHLGHITLDPDGPLCVCGNRGCLETYFSALAIEGEALAAAHRGCETRRLEEAATCSDIFQARQEGDPVAEAILSRAIRYLAAGLAGLCHALDPEVVILGGAISNAGPRLLEPVREQVWQRTGRLMGRKIPLLLPEVGDPTGVLGAAALAGRQLSLID